MHNPKVKGIRNILVEIWSDEEGKGGIGGFIQNSLGLNGWNGFRDSLESTADIVGNYFLPGSSLLSDQLVSKGSQNQLDSTIGEIAQVGSGLAGGGVGSSLTGIPGSTAGLAESSFLSNLLGGSSGGAGSAVAGSGAGGVSGGDALAGGDVAVDPNTFAPVDSTNAAAVPTIPESQVGQIQPAPASQTPALTGNEGVGNLSPQQYAQIAPNSAGASSPAGGNGILNTLKSAVGNFSSAPTPAGGTAGSGLLGFLQNNGKYLLPAASLAKSVIGPQYPKGTNELLTAGGNALNTEQGLISSLQTGQLPPGVQSEINQSVQDAQTAIRSKYAQMGETGSTAETQELNAAAQQGQTQALNYATNATSTGLSALGATNSIYNSIIQSVLGQNNQVNQALASLGGATPKTTAI